VAVVVTEQRTTVNEADATTGWTGSATVSLFTAEPTAVEATGCLGMVVSNATQNAFFTVTSVNLSGGALIYAWIFHRAELDTRVNGGVMIQLGDGTNRVGFHVAGNDVDGFRHSVGPVGWQCVVVDTANLPAQFTTFAGTRASLNLSAVTQIGVGFKTLVKAVGGVSNCFWDMLRRGSQDQGLLITGGTIGDPGKFSEIAATDRLTTNQRAHGVFRELGAGVFGVQGPLTFGDSGSSSSYFRETSTSVAFESRGLVAGRIGIYLQGGSGSTVFRLGTVVGSGDAESGVDGVSISSPSGVGGYLDFSGPSITELELYGCSFSGMSGGVQFSSYGTGHVAAGCSFASCGVIEPRVARVRNCRVTGFSASNLGAMLWQGTSVNVKRCEFTAGANGHGILITTPGTYTLDGMSFNGYGGTPGSNPTPSSGSTTAAIYNNSGGAVTLLVTGGGDTPSVRNGAGATTVVDAAVTVTISAQVSLVGAEIRVYDLDDMPAGSLGTELAGVESNPTATFSFSTEAGNLVWVQVMKDGFVEYGAEYTVPSVNASLPVTLAVDQNE